jgi:hypothetical protein
MIGGHSFGIDCNDVYCVVFHHRKIIAKINNGEKIIT